MYVVSRLNREQLASYADLAFPSLREELLDAVSALRRHPFSFPIRKDRLVIMLQFGWKGGTVLFALFHKPAQRQQIHLNTY